MDERICPECGESFTPWSRMTICCSPACAGARRSRLLHEVRTCACGVEFTARKAAVKKYCSLACFHRYGEHKGVAKGTKKGPYRGYNYSATHTCVKCGDEFTATRPTTKFCPTCKIERPESVTAACAWCGTEFVKAFDAHKYCSPKCGETAKAKRSKAIRRKCYVEEVSIAYLLERDHGKCKLCGKPVALGQVVPHPFAPTIDHIQPVSKGGMHERSNCQLAHFRCNCIKGNRGSDQLLLVG